jgi:S1-C subfamily serine protease
MRALLLALSLGAALAPSAFAQFPPSQPASSGVLQHFEGTAALTSPAFTSTDGCEVRWFGFQPLNVSVLAADGSVVAGGTANRGAIYLPKGGTYHLQIDAATSPMSRAPAPASPNSGISGFQSVINGNTGGGSSNPPQNQPPPQGYPANFTMPPWKVEVVDLNSPAAHEFAQLPNYVVPASAVAGAAPSSPAPAPAPGAPAAGAPTTGGKLTEDQARAVVLVTGDNAEGTGFMVKTPDGPAIITNIHVIANNPNLKITTNTGALVTVLSEKGASDRDLAMLAIKDFGGYSYLDVSTDISQTVQPGDEVITPGNSQGGEVMLNTPGKVLGIGPTRIEFDNPIYHGNSGGPVFHTKSGKVLGVVTEAIKVNMTNDLDKASFASRNSAISGSMRYFGLRIDTVTNWIPIDSRTFQNETAFLDQFHQQSLRLDSFLNRQDHNGPANGNTSSSDANLYQQDEKIMKACDSYRQQASGADTAQQLEALRGMLFDLQGIADTNVSVLENATGFYSFDRERAQDELAYRKALIAELNDVGNDVNRLGSLPRTNNE